MLRYSHVNRSTSFFNSFQTLIHVISGDCDSDGDFLLVGIVRVQAWREMVKTVDFLEGAMAAALLEHVEIGFWDFLAGLRAGGWWHYVFPSKDVLVKLHGSMNILNRDLSPTDGTGLFALSVDKMKV